VGARRAAPKERPFVVATFSLGGAEAWLINSELKRMVSVGVLPSRATEQDLRVTRSLIDQGCVIVDISREKFDDRPQHSGDSLLRGSLA